MAIVARVVGEAEAAVGIDGVEAAVLQRVSADLICKPDPAPFLAQVEQYAAAFAADDVQAPRLSCGPQSHFSEPKTSPVRHSLCSRTSGGLPPNAPTTSATCSCPSSEARKATIWRGRHVFKRKLGARDDLDLAG